MQRCAHRAWRGAYQREAYLHRIQATHSQEATGDRQEQCCGVGDWWIWFPHAVCPAKMGSRVESRYLVWYTLSSFFLHGFLFFFLVIWFGVRDHLSFRHSFLFFFLI